MYHSSVAVGKSYGVLFMDAQEAERKDELPSTGTAMWLWHVCNREKLDLPELPALWTVSSIVLLPS